MKKGITLCLYLAFLSNTYTQDFSLKSPDNRLQLTVSVSEQIVWQVMLNGQPIIEESIIGMEFTDGPDFGLEANISDHSTTEVSRVITPIIPHKDAKIDDVYRQLTLQFTGGYQLIFRAYDDGVAYQFVDQQEGDRMVIDETLDLTFPNSTTSIFPQEESLYSHNERSYLHKKLSDIADGDFCSLPVLFQTQNGNVLLTETALHDYPGLFIEGTGRGTLRTRFPPFILEIKDNEKEPDRSQTIVKEADYIAEVSGSRAYPWRVFIISDDDRTFVESNLTFQLARPLAIGNTDWIRPGKVAWDWYNANNIYGVDFKSGLNTDTYKYYIDFAADHGIEYVILDEGWTKTTTEILDFNPQMDVPELIRYGKEKGVELILWVLWKPLDANLTKILETYKSWGCSRSKGGLHATE